MGVAHYLSVGIPAATLIISSFGFYKTYEISTLVSSTKHLLGQRMEEAGQQRAEVKSKLERCLASSSDCTSLSLRYKILNEKYADLEQSSQKADEMLTTRNKLLVTFTATSAFGILSLAYAFKRKEKKDEAE